MKMGRIIGYASSILILQQILSNRIHRLGSVYLPHLGGAELRLLLYVGKTPLVQPLGKFLLRRPQV
jgi:hypothetical protein